MSDTTASESDQHSSSNPSQTDDTDEDKKSHSAFFYGTLMHPEVLLKILDSDGSHLEIAPATLQVRHQLYHHYINACTDNMYMSYFTISRTSGIMSKMLPFPLSYHTSRVLGFLGRTCLRNAGM